MQSIIQSKITTPTKTLIQPRIYECYLKGPCGDDYENLSQYVSKTEELHAGLRELLVGTKRADVQPRFIELQHDREGPICKVYSVDGGPASQLVLYDTLGIVIVSYKILETWWYKSYGSEFILKEFPSSKGKLLTERIEKLMAELEFKVPDQVDPRDFEQL